MLSNFFKKIFQKKIELSNINQIIDYIAEQNSSLKLNMYTPSTHIKIIDESIKDSYKLDKDDYKKNIFIVRNIVSEFSNPNLHNEKIIRTQVQLFITQNPPKDFSDYDCEIKKHKLREVFKTFKDKIPLLQSFETQSPPGFYLKEQYV